MVSTIIHGEIIRTVVDIRIAKEKGRNYEPFYVSPIITAWEYQSTATAVMDPVQVLDDYGCENHFYALSPWRV